MGSIEVVAKRPRVSLSSGGSILEAMLIPYQRPALLVPKAWNARSTRPRGRVGSIGGT